MTRLDLSALLSQALVAFTVEFDNEFEWRMNSAGYRGAALSMVVWNNLVRFLTEGAQSVRELAHHALAPEAQVRFQLGCLERWGLIALQADSTDGSPAPARVHRQPGRLLRDGWGSGRGIRSGWGVLLTRKGRKASEVWPPLFGEIERRWRKRFGHGHLPLCRHRRQRRNIRRYRHRPAHPQWHIRRNIHAQLADHRVRQRRFFGHRK